MKAHEVFDISETVGDYAKRYLMILFNGYLVLLGKINE